MTPRSTAAISPDLSQTVDHPKDRCEPYLSFCRNRARYPCNFKPRSSSGASCSHRGSSGPCAGARSCARGRSSETGGTNRHRGARDSSGRTASGPAACASNAHSPSACPGNSPRNPTSSTSAAGTAGRGDHYFCPEVLVLSRTHRLFGRARRPKTDAHFLRRFAGQLHPRHHAQLRRQHR